MPWLFNSTRDVQQAELADGTQYGFLPRKRVYVDLTNMSAAAWRLVQGGKLVNQGGDPIIVAPTPALAQVALVALEDLVPVAKPDTSSSHHQTDGRVAVDSSNASSGEKESKAVKKQDDDLEKATSGGLEVAAQDNDTSKKTEKRSKSSRKRS